MEYQFSKIHDQDPLKSELKRWIQINRSAAFVNKFRPFNSKYKKVKTLYFDKTFYLAFLIKSTTDHKA